MDEVKGEEPSSHEQALVPAGAMPPPPPPPPPEEEEGGEEEEGMVRMSFLGHLEELRSRLLKSLAGLGVAFLACLIFAPELWRIISAPATAALPKDGTLAAISVMEEFSVIYVKVPFMTALFVAAPWVLYQVWAFISPGLYRRERRWAAPFVLITAGLFISGGLFAYFVAFRFALTFLFGIGEPLGVKIVTSIDSYFDLFFNVTLGIALVFELPVLIFLLTLLRIVSPRFLLKHSRYAILAIVVIAAVVTPTPDAFNLTLFAVPMIALYFVGIFASYLLVLQREGRRFPWNKILPWVGIAVLLIAGGLWFAAIRYHLHFVRHWPFFMR